MSKILTIVIPSYNTSSYIDECMPYFLDERIINDLEILIINDGSKDNTAILAEKYVKKYPESIYLINKENGGHGSVINRGILEATGKYFKVVDGDDWVITNNLVALVQKLKEIDADLVINPFIRHNIVKKDETVVRNTVTDYEKVMQLDEVAEKVNTFEIHAITFRTSILKANNIKVQENCFYEDTEYDLYPIPYVDTVVFLEEPVYVYRIGSPTQSVNIANAVKNIDMHYKIVENLVRFYGALDRNISKEKYFYITKFVVSRIQSQYGIYLKIKFGKEAKKGIMDFDEKLKGLSLDLYEKSMTLPIRLIRSKLWLFYFIAYVSFKLKRIKRGF